VNLAEEPEMPPVAPQQNQIGPTWEPQAADSRLAKTAGASPSGVFTSDLSVSEYVLLGEAGFEPLGFVVGSSIYHVGLQIGRWGRNQELQVLTQAMYNAREFAMARMRAEVAFVLGTCVYHIAHRSVLQSLRQAYQNQEMMQFTQGVYEARELALDRMQAEAAQVGASGIVGVTVDVKNHVWGEHATEFLATGTAVRRLADEHKLPQTTPKPTFTLGLDH
jgi:uncharacterized protein YbjQ (UPF0145 family)